MGKGLVNCGVCSLKPHAVVNFCKSATHGTYIKFKPRGATCTRSICAYTSHNNQRRRSLPASVPCSTDTMYCHPPTPLYILILEHLELQFRVASKPVAALITVLIINGTLYIMLIPIVVHT